MMTLTERLEKAGIFDEWDAAVSSKNRFQLIELLCKVGLSEQAVWISEAALYGPKW